MLNRKILRVYEKLNQNALAIQSLLLQYKHLVVVDKKLSLYKLCGQKEAIKVDQRFFSTFGVQASDLRFLEYFLLDQEHQTYLYYGSWKWSNECYPTAGYDHIGMFSTDKHSLSIERLLFTGYDIYGNKSASFDSLTGFIEGNIHSSLPPWYARARAGFWIDTQTITSGSILATVHVKEPSEDKIHMQYDTLQRICPTEGLKGQVEHRGLGFYVTWDNDSRPGNTMYSNGVGNLP